MTARPVFTVSGSKTTGTVPTVQANGSVAWETPSGGAQPSISDVIAISPVGVTLDTDNSWNHDYTAAELAVGPSNRRGTDLSIVDNGGAAALHSVDGGDFAMHIFFSLDPATLDGGSTLPRYLAGLGNGSPNSDFGTALGYDSIVPVLAGNAVKTGVLGQPYIEVPADDFVSDFLLTVFLKNAFGTDSVRVEVNLMIWKLGPLPT